MSDRVPSDGFWRADTQYGKIIEKVVAASAAATPRRMAHMIGKALNDAGFGIYHQCAFGPQPPDDANPPKLKLVALRPDQDGAPSNQEVVRILEDALRDARRGSLTFIAMTGVSGEGSIQAAWGGEFKPVTCLAAVTDLRIRFEAQYLSATDPGGAA